MSDYRSEVNSALHGDDINASDMYMNKEEESKAREAAGEEQLLNYNLARAGMVHLTVPKLNFQSREAINVLRGNVLMSGYNIKVIAVTSAQAHEGKSSLAFQLAKSLAGLKKRVLFMDCDIRNSTILFRYKVDEEVSGLTEFLTGQKNLANIVYRTDDKYMDMVFTGASAPNPSELFYSRLFETMIRLFRQKYDYVIVDTPPINPVIDGTMIAKYCDGALLVVEAGVSHRGQTQHAKQQLEYAGVKIIGAVLNKIGTKASGYGKYGYGKYGRYGYGYGQDRKAKKKKS